MKVKFYIQLSVLIWFPATLFAQLTTIHGKVSDTTSHKAAAYVTVVLKSLTDSSFVRSCLTDSVGFFQLAGVSDGKYFLSLTSVEYQGKSFPVTLGGQFFFDVGTILLNGNLRVLNEVVVKGSRQPFVKKLDRLTINVSGNDFFRTATNVTDVLKRSPGVKITAENEILLKNNTAVTVLINGKLLPMSAEELGNYLNSLNKDDIESIDLIESPSAKYDSQYKGVIDIKLKKDKSLGLSGSASVYGQKDAFGRWGGNVSATYRTASVNYYASYSYNNIKTLYRNDITQFLDDDIREIHSIIRNEGAGTSNNYQFGADYAINKNNTVSITLKSYDANGNNPFKTLTTDFMLPSGDINSSAVTTDNDQTTHPKSYSINGSYTGQFTSGVLTFNAYYSDNKNNRLQNIDNMSIGLPDGLQSTDNTSHIQSKVAELDYDFNLGKSKLDIGSKFSNTHNTSNQLTDTLINGSLVVNPVYTDSFLYKETTTAGFAEYSFKLSENFSVQGGLRLEDTWTNGNSVTLNQDVKTQYLSWLPNLDVGILLDNKDRLDFTFTKRLTRPPFLSLDPFRLYLSPYSYTEGNPFLLPVKIDLGEVSYTHHDLTFTLSVKHQKDILAQIPYVDAVTNITDYKQTNIGSEWDATLDVDYDISITSWWKMQHYAALIYRDQQFPYDTLMYNRKNLSFSVNGTQSFSLPEKYFINLSYDYESANENLIYHIAPSYNIDFGIQKSFFNKRLDCKLNFTDIFYTSNPRMKIDVADYQSNILQRYNSRTARLQLTYSFGGSGKSNQSGKNIHAEEDNRSK